VASAKSKDITTAPVPQKNGKLTAQQTTHDTQKQKMT